MQDTMLEKYIKDIEKYPLLTAEREKELSSIILNSKDPAKVLKARNEMVECNLRMVIKIAHDLYARVSGMEDINVSLMDLIQAGNIGLMRAADLFSYKKNFKFCTYAYPSIIRKMKRSMMQTHFIKIPPHHFKHIAGLKNIENRINSGDISDKELREELHITDEMLQMIKKEKSTKVAITDPSLRIKNYVDENETPLNKQIEANQLRHYLFEKMKELKPFDRDVLFYKFFGNEEMTLGKIGKKYGVSREWVRQGIRGALKRLRFKIEDDRSMGNIKLKKAMSEI